MIRRSPLVLLGLFVTLGCQALFGDFEIDTSELQVSCRPGIARCSEGELQRCDRGRAWTKLLSCPNPNQCNVEALGCEPCVPGSFQCNEASLESCDETRSWRLSEVCAGPSQCRLAADGKGSCVAAECEVPGAHQCAPAAANRLQRCSDELMWEEVEACASPALCDAALADQQVKSGAFATCKTPACSPGQFSCATGAALPCNEAQTAFEGTCQADTCGACSGCAEGDMRCSGADLLACKSGAWSAVQTCASVFSCRATGATGECVPSTGCTPGEVSCEEIALSRCRSDGTAREVVTNCAAEVLCNAAKARCDTQRCATEDHRCVDKQLQKCLPDLSGWENDGSACPGVCDPEMGCIAEPCTSGFRCNDVTLEQCSAGAWAAVDRCVTPALCAKGLKAAEAAQAPVCAEQVCTPNQRRCALLAGENVPRAIQICSKGLDAYVDLYTCAAAEVCDMDTRRCAAPVQAE